jgi:hypothetical protein
VAIGLNAHPDATWPAPYLMDLIEGLGSSVGTEIEADVFADAGTVGRLRQPGWTPPSWVHLHDPGQARQASRVRVARLTSSLSEGPSVSAPVDVTSPGRIWADWIATGLDGRAVRALHVVLDPVWDAESAVLALSFDPSEPTDVQGCGFVTGDDVRRLADAVGAATLSLGCPPDTGSEEAMRYIADDIGQQRPGATIHSMIGRDPHGSALAALHAFLAGRRTRWVPRDRSFFAYVQPEQVQSSLAEMWPTPAPTAAEQPWAPAGDDPLPAATLPRSYQPSPEADVASYYSDAGAVPSWVAASERYVGQQLADLSRPSSAPEPSTYESAYEEGAAEALADLQAIIAKHAKLS